jgi:hypothetical protein
VEEVNDHEDRDEADEQGAVLAGKVSKVIEALDGSDAGEEDGQDRRDEAESEESVSERVGEQREGRETDNAPITPSSGGNDGAAAAGEAIAETGVGTEGVTSGTGGCLAARVRRRRGLTALSLRRRGPVCGGRW